MSSHREAVEHCRRALRFAEDRDGVLRGIVTIERVRQALRGAVQQSTEERRKLAMTPEQVEVWTAAIDEH